ncbi:MAG TPA: phosphotransferase [Candidatus Dormibacteraeota bacterium]|nr:phosphotransferase [Candidatus Dormibacteraeota bacterium]
MPKRMMEKVEGVIQAWLRLRPDSHEPREVTFLKNVARSTVCRLEGVGPGGSGIVAKRCPWAAGDLEFFIYSEILGALPMDSLRCYGFVEEDGGEYGWLFLEDGGIEPIVGKGESFPITFADWLGTLHGSTSSLGSLGRLPSRGPGWYREILQTAQFGLCQSLLERKLADEDRSAVEGILVCFGVLEQNWHEVEERCDGLPWALVHGDLQPKNIMTRRTSSGVTFLPLDWEEAGWGPPAADLAGIDAPSYWCAAQKMWPHAELRHVEAQVLCGSLFKNLAAVGWETVRLTSGSPEKALRRLRIYAPQMSASTLALGLEI